MYADNTKLPTARHPVAGEPIEGFQIPYWSDLAQFARDTARLHPENRSIGWNIAVTPDGPGLIEGNHDWCKLTWRLPVRCGLKICLDGIA